MSGGSLAVAVFLAVLPLVPAGPGYLGIDAASSVDAAVGVLLVIWMVLRVATRRQRGTAPATCGTTVLQAWLVLMVVVTGAMFVALAVEMRPGSPVFAEQMVGFPRRILQPLDFASDPFYSARVWLTFLEGFLVFAIIRDCCARAQSPQSFVRAAGWGWLAGLGTVSVLAVLQYVTRFHLHPLWVTRNPGLVRANATLDDPNALASYLVLGAGLAIGIALSERRRAVAVVAAVIGLTASLAVLTTASRVALIALPLSALFMTAFGPAPNVFVFLQCPALFRRIARGTLAGLGAAAIVLLAARLIVDERPASLPGSPAQAMLQTLDPRTSADSVLRDRLVYWGAALRMARQHPIAGIGLGRYPRELPDFYSRWVPLENTHNFFLQMQAEAGLVGLLAFVALWVIVIGALWRAARAGDRAGWAWGSLVGMVAFGVTLITGHSLVAPSGQVLWGSALALALGGSMAQGAPALVTKFSARSVAVRASILALCIYTVAAWRMPSPPRLMDRWGYSWGLFPEEAGFFPTTWNLLLPDGDTAPGPPGTRAAVFRWSGARTVVELQAPPDATACLLPFAAFLPSRVAGAQSITFRYGKTERTLDVRTSDLQTIQIPLTPDVLDGQRRLVVQIVVTPVFVPAKLGISPDQRTLGIQMFPARFD